MQIFNKVEITGLYVIYSGAFMTFQSSVFLCFYKKVLSESQNQDQTDKVLHLYK